MMKSNQENQVKQFDPRQIDMYKRFRQSFASSYDLLRYKTEQSEKNKAMYDEAMVIRSTLEKELMQNKQAITLLKTWYTNSKEESINALQNQINDMLSQFFNHDYNLRLVQDVKNGTDVLNLVVSGHDGTDITSIDIVLSGAEQQMAGYLIQVATTQTNSNGMMILDEAFSSFGVEEVAEVPKMLDFVDKQILIIEHKDELFDDFPILTYTLGHNELKGTEIIGMENRELANM